MSASSVVGPSRKKFMPIRTTSVQQFSAIICRMSCALLAQTPTVPFSNENCFKSKLIFAWPLAQVLCGACFDENNYSGMVPWNLSVRIIGRIKALKNKGVSVPTEWNKRRHRKCSRTKISKTKKHTTPWLGCTVQFSLCSIADNNTTRIKRWLYIRSKAFHSQGYFNYGTPIVAKFASCIITRLPNFIISEKIHSNRKLFCSNCTCRFSALTLVLVFRGVPKLVINFWESPLFHPACDGIMPEFNALTYLSTA